MCYTDECSFCKISEDVEHYLMHCHKYSASRLILFDRLRSLGLEELSVGAILGGGCSGPRQRSILRATAAFVKRTKWFSTYFRYWFLMTIVLIIVFELWFFRNFQEWRELLLLPYSFNTVKKKRLAYVGEAPLITIIIIWDSSNRAVEGLLKLQGPRFDPGLANYVYRTMLANNLWH